MSSVEKLSYWTVILASLACTDISLHTKSPSNKKKTAYSLAEPLSNLYYNKYDTSIHLFSLLKQNSRKIYIENGIYSVSFWPAA